MDPAIWFAGAAAIAATVSAIGTVTLAWISKRNVDLARASVEQNRRMVEEMDQARLEQDMPHVVVEDEYGADNMVDLVVRNLGTGAARNIEFTFSEAIKNSRDGNVSDVGYLKNGMEFLAPGAVVRCFWDMSFNLMSVMQQRESGGGVEIVTSYDSTHGHQYSTISKIDPLRFEGQTTIRHYGMHELSKSVLEMSKNSNKVVSMGELHVATKDERRRQDERRLEALRAEEEKRKPC